MAKRGLRFAAGGVLPGLDDDLAQRVRGLDMDRALLDAYGNLSNTERSQLAGNAPIPVTGLRRRGAAGPIVLGASPGSAAEASALRRRSEILGALRENLVGRGQFDWFRGKDEGGPERPFDDWAKEYTQMRLGTAPVAVSTSTAPSTESISWSKPSFARGGVLQPGKKKPCGLAAGGVVRISGPGTGTSDDIPLKVTGQGRGLRAHLSDGEALAVLPAKTAQDPRAVAAVEAIIEASTGKTPAKGLRQGGRYVRGLMPGDEKRLEEPWQHTTRMPGSDTVLSDAIRKMAEKMAGNVQRSYAPFDADTSERVQAAQDENNALRQAQSGGAAAQTSPASQPTPEDPRAAGLRAARQQALDQRIAETQRLGNAGFDLGLIDAARDKGVSYYSNLRDATDYGTSANPLPGGWGVISGEPDAQGLRRSALVAPETYTGADGRPTTRWTDTARYKQAMEDNERLRKRANDMERERITRTAAMPGATEHDKARYAVQVQGDRDAAAQQALLRRDALNRQAEMEREQLRSRTDLGVAGINATGRAAEGQRATAEHATKFINNTLDTLFPANAKDPAERAAQDKQRSDIWRALYSTYGGDIPTDPQMLQRQLPHMINIAKLITGLNRAVANRGVWSKLSNLFGANANPRQGFDLGMIDVKNSNENTIDYGGILIPTRELFDSDPGLEQAYMAYLQQAQAQRQAQ